MVAAAVGADTERGDEVTVIAGTFEVAEEVVTPFYDTSWFAMAARYGAGLIALLLGLLLGVRPIIKAWRGKEEDAEDEDDEENEDADGVEVLAAGGATASLAGPSGASSGGLSTGGSGPSAADELREQVDLARKLAHEQPERAVAALRRMLAAPIEGQGA